MCGIAGYYGKNKLAKSHLRKCLDEMKNRGPDNISTEEFININNINCYLLHSRLSIIDLDKRSNQPFTFENLVLIYNGEIYNFLEIRNELIAKGYQFKTLSDTEVLLKSYHCWGEKMFDKLEGMWAFAIFNKVNGKILLSRDRFGEKPLYFFKTNDGLFFASEIKYIKALTGRNFDFNQDQILRYITNGYRSLNKLNQTFYNEIHEFDLATYRIIDSNLNSKNFKYWKLELNVNDKISFSDATGITKKILIKSVNLRLRSDCPIAFCLSGGIDSTSLASIAVKELGRNISTFSIIDNDKRYDERENIKIIVDDLGCDHKFLKLDKSNGNFQKLKNLIKYHDAPISTITYFIHSLLSEQISKDGFKVSISGTGSDELFTGYYDHYNLQLYTLRNTKYFSEKYRDWERYVNPYIRNPLLKNPNLYKENPNFRKHHYLRKQENLGLIKSDFNEEFIEEKYSNDLLRNRMMNELFHETTRVSLHEDDLNSMKYSIENRSPFLDKNLSEFAYTIPNHLLINKGYAKIILRSAMNGILNDKVRLDRQKKGFNASISSIFDFKDKKIKEELLEPSIFFDFFDRTKFKKMFEKDFFENSESQLLFNLVNTKLFLDGS